MLRYPEMLILLTLTTADGCTGVQLLGRDAAMTWDTEPDAETTGAGFKSYRNSADMDARIEPDDAEQIMGYEWREMESQGEAGRVLYWVQRGASLRAAIESCIDGCDPDGFDSDDEEELDNQREQLAALQALADSAVALLREAATPSGIGEHESSRAGGWMDRARALLATVPA